MPARVVALFVALAAGLALPSVSRALPAFPGAEGAGANALGGRGGDVYYVTNLNDTGAGSLRQGITSATVPRTILFKVSGNIVLASTLNVTKSRITIAGQTAPGDGICLQNYRLGIQANDVVVRHLRSRLGTLALQESDSIWISSGTNIIVDHCSASWSVDETFSSSDQAANVTVQWCYITESLNNSIHSKGRHGYGSIIGPAVNTAYSWHHNLYAHHYSRSPRLGSGGGALFRVDFCNNLIYNWRDRAGYSGGATEFVEANYVANYLVAGPDRDYNYAMQGDAVTTVIYQSGNRIDLDRDGIVDGTNSGWGMFSGTYTPTNAPFPVPTLAADTAPVAYQRVLAQGGAMPWHRDACDARVTATVLRQNGSIVDFVGASSQPTEYITNTVSGTNYIGVRGWPALSSAAAPVDADNDGMPDYWELALGSDPGNAADRNSTNAAGYTRLEEYLNWLADPHGVSDRNGQVDVDLRQLNGGLSNLSFVVANGTNGSVSLLGDGYTARFVPASGFNGLAGFTYDATDPTNSVTFGPVPVGILVSTTNAPNTPPSLAALSNQVLVAGATLQFACSATDTDLPPQTLMFTLADAPDGAEIGATNGVFHWRPAIAQGGATYDLQVLVADSGIPSLSATQAFAVTVNPPARPELSQPAWAAGQFSLMIGGDAGPDYTIQSSSNLVNWSDRFTTNSPGPPFRWTDPEVGGPVQFYRVLLGP